MSLFLTVLLITYISWVVMRFFSLYSVDKNKNGSWKITPFNVKKNSDEIDEKSEKNFMKKKFYIGGKKLFISILLIVEAFLFLLIINQVSVLIEVRASQIIPEKFAPISRFAADIDWETKTVNLDASMSKAFEDNIQNYIWRIDDGTSLVGEKTLKHVFKTPGYYFIQLSIVDGDNQSDSATCQILIPPEELEKVETGQTTTSNMSQETISSQNYEWVPVGEFYNYSKMNYGDRSYANLMSRYVESGCGYSNRSYDTRKTGFVDFIRDNKVQIALKSITRNLFIALILIPGFYIGVNKILSKRKTS